MKEKIANPLSVKEALELDKESIIPITDYWVNDTDGSSYNKLPFAVRMPKGLVTQAEEERRKGRYSVLFPSCGSDAPYFADMITEPIEKFDAHTSLTDEKRIRRSLCSNRLIYSYPSSKSTIWP